jgi:hypothetical protein
VRAREAHLKKRTWQFLLNFNKSNISELFVGLNDFYWIIHAMYRKNMKKLQKLVYDLNGKENIFFMKRFQGRELGGSKGDQYEVFLFLFTINALINNNN